MKTLDASHRTLLDNFATFERAQLCLKEIEKYLWEVLVEVANELPAGRSPAFEFKLDKGGWMQANAFPDWQGTSNELIGIGIENFGLGDMISGEGCQAYVFCLPLGDTKAHKKYAALSQHLRSLLPPDGFTLAPAQYHGYMFVKSLGSVPVNTFCSRSDLKKYLREPLDTLATWLSANGTTFAASPAPSKD